MNRPSIIVFSLVAIVLGVSLIFLRMHYLSIPVDAPKEEYRTIHEPSTPESLRDIAERRYSERAYPGCVESARRGREQLAAQDSYRRLGEPSSRNLQIDLAIVLAKCLVAQDTQNHTEAMSVAGEAERQLVSLTHADSDAQFRANSYYELSRIYSAGSNRKKAAALAVKALAVGASTLGFDHPLVDRYAKHLSTVKGQPAESPAWERLTNKAVSLQGSGNTNDALKIAREAAAEAEAALGPDSPEVGDILALVSLYEFNLGKFDEAIDAARRSISILQATDTQWGSEFVSAHVVLTAALASKRILSEADRELPLALKFLRMQHRALGPDDTANFFAMLAASYMRDGALDTPYSIAELGATTLSEGYGERHAAAIQLKRLRADIGAQRKSKYAFTPDFAGRVPSLASTRWEITLNYQPTSTEGGKQVGLPARLDSDITEKEYITVDGERRLSPTDTFMEAMLINHRTLTNARWEKAYLGKRIAGYIKDPAVTAIGDQTRVSVRLFGDASDRFYYRVTGMFNVPDRELAANFSPGDVLFFDGKIVSAKREKSLMYGKVIVEELALQMSGTVVATGER